MHYFKLKSTTAKILSPSQISHSWTKKAHLNNWGKTMYKQKAKEKREEKDGKLKDVRV